MEKERIEVAIVSDKNRVNLRPKLQEEIERNPHFEVILLSREKISRIRQEIKRDKPDLVLVTASLSYLEEVDELRGFVKKLRKHLPQAKIVIHSPHLSKTQRETVFKAGANGWIDHKLADKALAQELEKVTSGEETLHPSIITKKKAA